MSKSRKITAEERNKIAQELAAAGFDDDIKSLLVPSKERRKSLKTPIEKLKNYNSIVRDSVFWASRPAYLEMLQSFLSKKIDGETLITKFFGLRTQNMINANELCAIIEDQILPIPDLYYTFKANDFRSTINELFLELDRYDSNLDDSDWYDSNIDGSDPYGIVYNESELRSLIQKEFVPQLQYSCALNDSFFRPQMDLDQLIRRSYLIFIISSLSLFTSLITKLNI